MSIEIMNSAWQFDRGGSEKLVLLAMANWADDDGNCYPSIAAIAHRACLSEVQARRVVHGLISDGYITVTGNHNGGRNSESRKYRINVSKLQTTPLADDTRTTLTDDRGTPLADESPPLSPVIAHPSHGRSSPLSPVRANTSLHINYRDPKSADALDCPHQEILKLYHQHLPNNPKVKVWTEGRRKLLQTRWRECMKPVGNVFGYASREEGLAKWGEFFSIVGDSAFLTGQVPGRNGGPPFLPDLEWLLKPTNFAKVLENRYHQEAA